MSQPNGSSRLDRIEQALESHDKILTRIENQQLEFQAEMREMRTSLRDLETIVGNLAKTVNELVRAITAAGRTNGGKP